MTTNGPIQLRPIDGASFGARCAFAGARGAEATVLAAEENRDALLDAFYGAGGFLLLEGMEGIREDPTLLLRLSRLFGPEVEDYWQTIRARHDIHPEVPEILLIAATRPI